MPELEAGASKMADAQRRAQRMARERVASNNAASDIDDNAPPPASDDVRDDVLLSLSSVGEGLLWLLLVGGIVFMALLNG